MLVVKVQFPRRRQRRQRRQAAVLQRRRQRHRVVRRRHLLERKPWTSAAVRAMVSPHMRMCVKHPRPRLLKTDKIDLFRLLMAADVGHRCQNVVEPRWASSGRL